MISTNRQHVIGSPEELAQSQGIDLDAPLTPAQKKWVKFFGLDEDKVRKNFNLRDFDSVTISKQELEARTASGESAEILGTSEGDELSEGQRAYAIKFGVHPEKAKRTLNTTDKDYQNFIPKGEREAIEKRNEPVISKRYQ